MRFSSTLSFCLLLCLQAAFVEANYSHRYDWRGNITQTAYADSSNTQNSYDASGYLTQSTDEAGYTTTYSYYDDGSIASTTNAEAETTAYAYEIYGNIAQTTRPLGNITQHSYNALSQLIQVDKPENYSARYTYDLNGNLRHQTTPAANDSGESHVEYQYDKNHRRIAHIQTTHSDPISTTYSYDAEGLMLTKTDANGELFEYRYDALGRLSEATIPAGNQADINTIATEYDANHNITEVVEHKTSGTETTTFTYDSLERQTQQIQRGYAVNYDYDDVGNRTEVATSGGSTDYSFNSRNRLSNATSNNQATAYTYLANGWQQSVSYPNNTETLITYDQVGRSTQLINQHNTQGILSQYDYAYDSNGNRTTQTENQQGFAAQQQQTTTYGYDGLDRLTSTDIEDSDSGANTLTEYGYYPSYDRASQTITHTDAQGTDLVSLQREYLYDELHRLTQINNTLNSSNISYNYDNNGNTLSKTDNSNSDTTQFSYNSRNQLKAVNKNGSNQGQYDYNYAGLRISNGGSNRGNINYYHDGLTVIDETSNGSPYAHYNYANRLISLSTPSDTQYYHFSALNTTANLTNSNGDIQASYRTDVFGDITEQQGSTENRHVFTGHEHDTETDLIYIKARYYDPDAGRFLQQDSYLGEAGTPPSLHRYVYAYGNPTVWVDLNGNAAYFFDGTDQDMNASNTVNRSNIGKMFDLYDGKNRFYEAGVGTNESSWATNKIGTVGGYGGDARLERMYENLVLTYSGYKKDAEGKLVDIKPDRDIDISGFSRGAALARSFGNLIDERGIPDIRSGTHTVKTGHGRSARRKEVANIIFESPSIRSLLIYDTVGSFGIAGNAYEGNKNLSIAPNVQNVRHATANDEQRGLFPLTSAIDPLNPDDPRIVEKGFPGAHSDIGGSYSDDDSLSHDTLFWMREEAVQLGVPFNQLKLEDMPVVLGIVKPQKLIRPRHGRTPPIYGPQGGSRTMHDSRYLKYDSPRKIIHLQNKKREQISPKITVEPE